MFTGFDELLKRIKNKGVELSPEDVADSLWLATRLIDTSKKELPKTIQTSQKEQETSTKQDTSHDKQLLSHAQQKPNKQKVEDYYRRRIPTSTKTANLFAYGEKEGNKKRGYAIGVPGVSILPQMLEMERALRPLARRKPSKRTWVIDEAATANFIASTNIWNIIQRPSEERWLEAVLVIEQSPTMRIWQEALREFQHLLWRTRAFSWMETLHIDAFSPLPRLTPPMDRHRNKNPNSLTDPNSSRMILLCTDCLSDAWLSGKIPEWLSLWEKKHPTIVLQMLPQYMWRQTSLSNANFIAGSTTLPVSAPRSLGGKHNANQIKPIPIIPLSPESLQDLAKFITAAPENQITCYKNDPLDFREIPIGVLDTSDEHYPLDKEDNPSEIFEHFKEIVSPITFELARYLAIVPLFLPIMRLVQHTFIPTSHPAHLAELFNSGILYRLSNSSLEENTNRIEFDFLPGIRDELLRQGSKPRIRDVWEVLTNYLNERFERGFDFLSILHDPTSTQEFTSGVRDESQRPFARVGAIILRRLGGDYAGAAGYLDDIAEFGHSNTQETNIKESFDKSNTNQAEDTTKPNRDRSPKPEISAGRKMYHVAEQKIQQALQSSATKLSIVGMGLTELPEALGQLTQLKLLDLSDNYFKTLPDSIGQLTYLQSLNLSNNELTTLPETIGYLTQLRSLDLSNNQFTLLPLSIGQLINLDSLNLSSNEFKTCPEAVGQLVKLQSLNLSSNPLLHLPAVLAQLTELVSFNLSGTTLDTIPQFIKRLIHLKNLDVSQNQITDIPAFIAQLDNLESLNLSNNPLNPALQSAYHQGLDSIKAYLRSFDSNTELLYEAKLVLIGEGNVGKTTLLKALKGNKDEAPQKNEPTTHGVEINIRSLRLPHPAYGKDGVEIQLNALDFGGQDVYRVTHQFFFSRRSLYLLVWEPRNNVLQGRLDEWLDMIRLRVGDDARVIIVSTHSKSGGHLARIDKPVFKQQYGDMIVDFCEVDSLVPDPDTGEMFGIAELKRVIAEQASQLEQMGMGFSRNWKSARDELIARPEPRISYATFGEICTRHGLSQIDTDTLAHLMHDLGYIIHFSDDERLRDDVVLKPQWLTKAIGFVLEDKVTDDSEGILPDTRLYKVWHDHSFEGEPRYDAEHYPFFLRLMEKYDISYRLPEGDASLVAFHVPQIRPTNLPWLPEEEPKENQRRLGMVCVMDDAPPGLVPWMIVRTHDYAFPIGERSLHWQKGMFLKNDRHGEAMLELRGREFHMYAEAIWPEYFMNILRQTLDKLITDNWPGMQGRYSFTVPCKNSNCEGRFEIAALRDYLNDGDETIRCQKCRERQNITELLYGFESYDVREELIEIQRTVERGFANVGDEYEKLRSQIANNFLNTMKVMASEAKNGPRLFTIEPVDGRWQWSNKKYKLHLWCEAEDCQHPVYDADGLGIYEFNMTREWIVQIAPYANFIVGVMKTLLPMVAPSVNVLFGSGTFDQWKYKDHLSLIQTSLSSVLPEGIKVQDPGRLKDGVLTETERSGILALHSFLRELDPNQERIGLYRIPTYTGDFAWVCKKHYDLMQSNIPDVISSRE